MASIVIGCRCSNTYFLRHRTYCTTQGCSFLDIKSLGNETITDPKALSMRNLINQIAGAIRCAG